MNKRNNPNVKALQQSNRGMYYTIAALIGVAVLVLGAVVFFSQRNTEASAIEFGSTVDPAVEVNDAGAIILGEDAAPTVQIWEDYMCPACGQFEATQGEAIADAVQNGELQVEYHLLNFMDGNSASGEYSTRSIAATQCVAANEDLDTFFSIKSALFANQPGEGRPDVSADEMAEIAASAGGTDSVDCIANVERTDGMDKAEQTADNSMTSIREVRDGVSTPTVAYEGEELDFQDPNWLAEVTA